MNAYTLYVSNMGGLIFVIPYRRNRWIFLSKWAQLCTTKAQEIKGFRRLKWAQKKAELTEICIGRLIFGFSYRVGR